MLTGVAVYDQKYAVDQVKSVKGRSEGNRFLKNNQLWYVAFSFQLMLARIYILFLIWVTDGGEDWEGWEAWKAGEGLKRPQQVSYVAM